MHIIFLVAIIFSNFEVTLNRNAKEENKKIHQQNLWKFLFTSCIYSGPNVANSSPDRVFKVVFLGNSGVGKSTFIHRFCYNRFLAGISSTIGNSGSQTAERRI
uniref:Uncharacterized protein n=1 Tax=Podarcis muralis TaxID=64176 RepID=A0A670ICU7_PODMU